VKPSVKRVFNGDLPILIFSAIRRRSFGFRINVEYAASFWHLYYTRRSFQAPVRSSRHRIEWDLLQEFDRLAMVIHYSLYESFKV
jgi:hypothetical protein